MPPNRALARIGADLIRDDAEDTSSSRQSKVAFPQTRDELLRDYDFNFAQRLATLIEDTGTDYTAVTVTSGSATISSTAINALPVNSLAQKAVSGTGIPADTIIISNGPSGAVMNVPAAASGTVTVTVDMPKAPWQHSFTIPSSLNVLKVIEIAGNENNRFQVIGYDTNRRILCDIETTDGFLQIKFTEQVIDPGAWDPMFKDAFVLRLASKLAVPLVKRADLGQVLQQEFAAIYSLAKKASGEEAVLQVPVTPWTDRSGA